MSAAASSSRNCHLVVASVELGSTIGLKGQLKHLVVQCSKNLVDYANLFLDWELIDEAYFARPDDRPRGAGLWVLRGEIASSTGDLEIDWRVKSQTEWDWRRPTDHELDCFSGGRDIDTPNFSAAGASRWSEPHVG